MADAIVTTPADAPTTVPVPIVYTRPNWESGWVERSCLYCDFAEHAAAPTMSNAQFSYEYGEILRPGRNEFLVVPPLDIERHYIKLEFSPTTGIDDNMDGEIDTATWYGIVLADERTRHGSRKKALDPLDPDTLTRVPSGTQRFHAVGMEWLMTRDPITQTFNEWHGPVPGTWDAGVKLGRALAFNSGTGVGVKHEKRGNKAPGVYRFKLTPRHSGEDWGTISELWDAYWITLYLVFGLIQSGQKNHRNIFCFRIAF